MRLLDGKTDRALARLTVYLTREEAEELRDSLSALLATSGVRHEHVSSSDYKKELTVCLYNEANLDGFNERSKTLIRNDE
jgi:hypothetical protein